MPFENDLTTAIQYFKNLEDDSITCDAAKLAELTACALFGSSSFRCKAAHATCFLYAQENARNHE